VAVAVFLTILSTSLSSNAQNMATRIATYKVVVDTSVTNKTAVNSIKATTVGTRYKDLADIVKSLVDTVRANVTVATDTPTFQQTIIEDSVTSKGFTVTGDSTKVRIVNGSNEIKLHNPGIFTYLLGKVKMALGFGGSGSTSYGTQLFYYGDSLSYNQIYPAQQNHVSTPYADTLPYGSGRFARTIDYPDTSTMVLFSDTLTNIATRRQLRDTAAANRTFVANNYWNHELAQTLGHTGKLLAADSQAMVMGSENIVRDSMVANGSQRIINSNSTTASSGTSYGLHLIDTNNVTGSSTRAGLQITTVLTAGGTNNFAFRASVSGGATLMSIPLSGQTFINGGISTSGASTMGTIAATTCSLSASNVITSAASGVAFIINKTGVGAGDNAMRTQTAGVTDDTLSKGVFSLRGICGYGSAPTIEDSTGVAGSTLTVSGTDMGGYITIT